MQLMSFQLGRESMEEPSRRDAGMGRVWPDTKKRGDPVLGTVLCQCEKRPNLWSAFEFI